MLNQVESLNEFIQLYEDRTNTHDFTQVAELIAEEAVYWFPSGCHVGISAIRQAFNETWDRIREETYTFHHVQWIAHNETMATCTYSYTWRGIVEGIPKHGGGRGTNVLLKDGDSWKIVHEHLSRHPEVE